MAGFMYTAMGLMCLLGYTYGMDMMETNSTMNDTMGHSMHHDMHSNMTHNDNTTDMPHDMVTDGHMGHGGMDGVTNGHMGHGGHGADTVTGSGQEHHMTAKDEHAGHNMGGGDSMAGGSTAHHAQTYFFLSTSAVILFEEWVATSTTTFIGSCVAVAIIAALYEGLKLVRELLRQRERQLMYDSKSTCGSMCCCLHLFQTLLHMIQMFISYCLMMVFMLFNAYLCLSIILGAGLGYMIMGWKKRYLNTDSEEEHCH